MTEQRRDTPPTLSIHGGLRPRSPSEALEPGRAPSRPARNKKVRKPQSRRVGRVVRLFSGILTVSLIVLVSVTTLSAALFHQFSKPGPLTVTQTVSIPKGEGRIEIARRLERDGIISSRWAFVAGYLMHSGWGRKPGMDLKAGEYEIKKGASMRDVLDTLIEGKSVLYKVTIPEGLTTEQVVNRLNAAESLTGEIQIVPAEGSVLPDTYSFSKNADRQEVLARMMAAQQKVLAKLWENRQQDLPINSPEEAVILASIVEKETGRADERDRVAGVFVNRLRKKMRLQSDPTIIYGIVGGKGRLDRSITKKDIAEKTEYNTYRIDGLPPGPIANPGRAALEATLNPANTEDIYFVANGTGGHTFSKTLREHNAAVAKWRQVERQRRLRAREQAAGRAPVLLQGNAAGLPIPNPSTTDADGDDVQVAPITDVLANQETAGSPDAPAAADASPGERQKASQPEDAESAAPEPLTGLRASTIPLPIRRPSL